MKRITHNFNTAIKTLAKILSTELRRYPNLYNIKELNINRDLVTAVRENLKQDSDKLIRGLNKNENIFLPKILLVISPQIEMDKANRLDSLPKSITISDGTTFKGRGFRYKSAAQLVVFSRNEYVIRELSLLLLEILLRLKEITYCLKVFDDAKPNDVFILEDYARLIFKDVETAAYVQEDNEGSKLLASALEFYIEDEFFIMSEDIGFKANDKVQKAETKLNVDKDPSLHQNKVDCFH